MNTLLSVFIIALALSIVGTPIVGKLGVRFGAMDRPDERKIHTREIPRCGGIIIFGSFLLTLIVSQFLATGVSDLLVLDRQITLGLLGAVVVFGVGLLDDFRPLDFRIKFLFQLVAATLAFWGGFDISEFEYFGALIEFGALSYFITVFWILLFINAVNLIDGLDGLAAGVTFFTALVMTILSILRGDFLTALLFATLAGSILGFLRYNFNPASIFMGDGGSYFIGYAIACIAIMGSVKSQTGALMLIPLLAMGVPVFDTLLSPVRRFILGRRPFSPDKDHIHHRLLRLGISKEKVVLIIYGVSIGLCAVALVMMYSRDKRAGLFLIILAVVAFVLIQKLGYFEYLAFDKFYGWLRDVRDVSGFSRDRRTFLSLQIEITASKSMDEMWQNLCDALDVLKFSRGELILGDYHRKWSDNTEYRGVERRVSQMTGTVPQAIMRGTVPIFASEKGDGPPHVTSEKGDSPHYPKPESAIWQQQVENEERKRWIWTRGPYRRSTDVENRKDLFRVELPLLNEANGSMGTLLLIRDLRREPLDPYTIRRVEHLRRTLVSTLKKLLEK